MNGTDNGGGGDRRRARRRSAFGRGVILWAGAVLAVIIAGYAAFQLSPWPGALLIRTFFDYDAAQTARALEPHVPAGIVTRANLSYDDADPDALLDLYLPADAESGQLLPVIVWVHGGGWVSGSRENVGTYAKILAGEGYAVAAVGYSLAPAHTYPRPVRQVNAALAFIAAHATELGIDASRFVLAGDSAGAQIAAQVANAISDPGYGAGIGIAPGLGPGQLRATLLYSGGYDLSSASPNGLAGWFARVVLWAYSGRPDFAGNPEFKKASVLGFVTADFPPSFISAGNGDPLLEQSIDLAAALERRGVDVETLFFPQSLTPALPHIYQFHLDTEGGQEALRRSTLFLQRVLAPR